MLILKAVPDSKLSLMLNEKGPLLPKKVLKDVGSLFLETTFFHSMANKEKAEKANKSYGALNAEIMPVNKASKSHWTASAFPTSWGFELSLATDPGALG